MTANLSRIGVVLTGLCCFSVTAAETMQHDPFARPLITNLSTTNTTTAETVVEEVIWNPALTAVMVAGKNSLVNVDGVIVKLGEEIDGYRLIEVKDYQAIFKKGRKRVVLTIAMQSMRKNKE